MSVDKQETAAESRLQWLDEELRQAKAALHKVEHELEQALNQIWNLDSGLRKLEEGGGDSGGVGTALSGRSEEMGRQQQSDLERERQERAALLKQAEAAARSVGQFEARIQLLEESLRHVEESVAELRLSHQTLTREIEELANRGARNLETALRLEHQAGGLAGEVEALQKRDGEIEDRLNLFEERVHRGEERVDKFEQHLSLPLDIKEQLDRGRFERQQMAERLGKLETSAGELVERTAEFVQSLARLDQRTQGQTGRLMEIAQDLQQQRETIFEQMKKLVRTMERQRRRQAEALAQEIKELGRSEFSSEQ